MEAKNKILVFALCIVSLAASIGMFTYMYKFNRSQKLVNKNIKADVELVKKEMQKSDSVIHAISNQMKDVLEISKAS